MPRNSIIQIDQDPKYKLSDKVTKTMKGDEWNEMVYTTRISYAVSKEWISTDSDWSSIMPGTYREFREQVSSGQGLGDGSFVEDFVEVTNRVFHDALESVARV